MLHRLRSKNVDADLRAIAAALALAPFLWALKLHLAWWMVHARGVHPLADVPTALVPLLAAQDLTLCAALAVAYGLLFVVTTPLPGTPRRAVRFTLTALIGSAVALFSVASWKVQQIYGCALEVAHLRAATGGAAVMRDSMLAYLSPGTIAVLLAAIAVGSFGGFLLRPILARASFLRVRWRLWALLIAAPAALYFADKVVIRERYTFGLEQNAILHFFSWYEREPKPAADVAELLRDTPTPVIARDEEFRRFTPFAPLRDNSAATAPGLPLRSAPQKLNVLLILLESTPAMYVDRATAPNICRLADSGVTFDHHFTTICETYKAVYSLLFSDYMVNLGTLPRLVYHRPMPQPSLPQVLQSHGYRTAFFHSGFLRLGDLGYVLKGFDTITTADDLHEQRGALGWRYGVFEEHTVAALSDWLHAQSRSQQPFFAVYSTMFPHHPYYSPAADKPFGAETQLGRYRNALHYTDANVGVLLDTLAREGLTGDTLIAVLADHGETVSSWPCGHGVNFSLEELHVPLILCNPKLLPAAAHYATFTQHPDLAPTLLGLLGIAPPPDWLGRDLCAPAVPLRAFPVKQEQSHFAGIIDNGLVYRLDEQSSRGALLQISGEQLEALSGDDRRNDLSGAYADRLSLFDPWTRWRHFRRALAR